MVSVNLQLVRRFKKICLSIISLPRPREHLNEQPRVQMPPGASQVIQKIEVSQV